MGRGHSLRHGAARAPERFRRPSFDQALGSTLNVGTCDGAIRTCRLHKIEVNLQLARQGTHRRQDLTRLGPCPMITDRLADHGLGPFGVQFPHHRPGINVRALSELDKRSAHLDQVSLASEQASHAPTLWRGELDHSLVGLDGEKRLVNNDMIPFSDVPGDDFRFLKTLSEIRQQELTHNGSNLGYVNRQTWRAALTIRSMDGM